MNEYVRDIFGAMKLSEVFLFIGRTINKGNLVSTAEDRKSSSCGGLPVHTAI